MGKIYYDKDVDLEILKDKTIAVIGYGSQGSAQANNLKDSGMNVVLGLRKGKESWAKAISDGHEVYGVEEASKLANFVQVLIPDEVQAEVYENSIRKELKEGDVLGFSHGFNIHFKQIIPPKNIDVVMVAPKAPGAMLRKNYQDGFGVPALFAIEQNYSGNAEKLALAYAKAIGSTRVGVLRTSFREETETDLFGEQVDLCGGVTELIKASFETLVKEGYQPELAYFETLHELKLIVDLIHKKGITGMWENVSNTAEYGGLTRGKLIINKDSKEAMKKILKEIQSGKFAKEWVSECRENKMRKLLQLRKKESESQIENVGRKLRKMMWRA